MPTAGGSLCDPSRMAHIISVIVTERLSGRRSKVGCSVLLDCTNFLVNVILQLNRRMFVYNFVYSAAAELLRDCLVLSIPMRDLYSIIASTDMDDKSNVLSSDAAELLRVCSVFGIPMRELCFNMAFTTREP